MDELDVLYKMLFENLQQVYRTLLVASPLLAVALMIIGLIAEGKKALICILGGIATGFFGCILIQPVDPGPWGWGFFAYLFLFPYWFSLGYLALWAFQALSCQPRKVKLGAVLLVVIVVFISTLILHDGYSKRVEGYAYESVRSYLNGNLSQSDLEGAGFHKTKVFKNEVGRFLDQSPEMLSESQVRFLADLGFNVYKCINCPRDLIDKALEFRGNADAGSGLPMFGLNSLAENPMITESDFVKLATLGEDDIFRALIVNPETDEKRYSILRTILVQSIDAIPVTDDSDWHRNRLQERLQHLDDERQRRLLLLQVPSEAHPINKSKK